MNIDPDNYDRVIILGPSHHEYLPNCALTQYKELETPLGNLTCDLDLIEELHKTELFQWMPESVDLEEHSIEMHLPFVKKVFLNKPSVKVVPILVGDLESSHEEYG